MRRALTDDPGRSGGAPLLHKSSSRASGVCRRSPRPRLGLMGQRWVGSTGRRSAVPRHREIDDRLARATCRQLRIGSPSGPR